MIKKDKFLHFVFGFLFGTATYVFSSNLGGSGLIPTLSAIGAGVVTGGAKELYDKISGKGTVEFMDFVFTVLGSAVAAAVLEVFLFI